MTRLFIQAMNVHTGGGRSQLIALLSSLPSTLETVVQVDQRCDLHGIELKQNVVVRRIKPSVFSRLKADCALAKMVKNDDVLLSVANLPPLCRVRGRVCVFLQNRYLIDSVPTDQFGLLVRLRIAAEKIWFRWRSSYVDEFIVQTPSMKHLLGQRLGMDVPIRIAPFVDREALACDRSDLRASGQQKVYDFVYVASGDPHKNHDLLLDAWLQLAEGGVYPSLCLTINTAKYRGLSIRTDEVARIKGLRITNVGEVSRQRVAEILSEARALIYPSTLESFGLPLIEAKRLGLGIVASELDYVRDVVDPDQTFDPNSAVSIARAVKRFMGIKSEPLQIVDATTFLGIVLGNDP